jgi:hypothetical protein
MKVALFRQVGSNPETGPMWQGNQAFAGAERLRYLGFGHASHELCSKNRKRTPAKVRDLLKTSRSAQHLDLVPPFRLAAPVTAGCAGIRCAGAGLRSVPNPGDLQGRRVGTGAAGHQRLPARSVCAHQRPPQEPPRRAAPRPLRGSVAAEGRLRPQNLRASAHSAGFLAVLRLDSARTRPQAVPDGTSVSHRRVIRAVTSKLP